MKISVKIIDALNSMLSEKGVGFRYEFMPNPISPSARIVVLDSDDHWVDNSIVNCTEKYYEFLSQWFKDMFDITLDYNNTRNIIWSHDFDYVLPTGISFAGVDDNTNIYELIALSEYGKQNGLNIEFGILLSGKNGEDGYNRYPSIQSMRRFLDTDLNLSLHLCGKFTSEPMTLGTFSLVKETIGNDLFNKFKRIQLNVVSRKTKMPIIDSEGKEIIMQANLNDKYSLTRLEFYKHHQNVIMLCDASGGNGISGDYQCYETDRQGYAGGINADNVIEVIKSINNNLQGIDQDYYLDLESGCREDDWFSTTKCKEIIDNVIKARKELNSD